MNSSVKWLVTAEIDDEDWSTIIHGKVKANTILRRVHAERASERQHYQCKHTDCTHLECRLNKERLCTTQIRKTIPCTLMHCPYGSSCEFYHAHSHNQNHDSTPISSARISET